MDITSAHLVVSLMDSVLSPSSTVGGVGSGSLTSGDGAKVGVDFGAVLKSSLDRVDASQQKAESISRSFEVGNDNVGLHDVMLSLQKANIDMQTAVQVRSKFVLTYQSIMSMSIWNHFFLHVPFSSPYVQAHQTSRQAGQGQSDAGRHYPRRSRLHRALPDKRQAAHRLYDRAGHQLD